MPAALALSLLNAVALCLGGLGTLGALLAAAQLAGWLGGATPPVVAEVWRHSGATGTLLVGLFRFMPAVLGAAALFHGGVAWLGAGLYRRRPWARPAALAFAAGWVLVAALACVAVRYALDDLAIVDPARAAFARAAETLALELTALNAALGGLVALVVSQPAVRAAFSAGSAGTSRSSAGPGPRA